MLFIFSLVKLGRAAAPQKKTGGRRRAFRFKSSLRSCLPCCGLSASIPHAGLRLYALAGSMYFTILICNEFTCFYVLNLFNFCNYVILPLTYNENIMQYVIVRFWVICLLTSTKNLYTSTVYKYSNALLY